MIFCCYFCFDRLFQTECEQKNFALHAYNVSSIPFVRFHDAGVFFRRHHRHPLANFMPECVIIDLSSPSLSLCFASIHIRELQMCDRSAILSSPSMISSHLQFSHFSTENQQNNNN